MRKVVVVAAVALMVGVSAYGAGTIADNCGCGLGTMALGDQESTLISNLAATFLNGLCGNQTFGITSGTLGCERPAAFASNKQILEYVGDNMDRLVIDIASGEGDSLNSLADLMSVSATDRPAMFGSLQSNFGRIFTSADVTASDVVRNIEGVLRS
jgi:hypothetical protein